MEHMSCDLNSILNKRKTLSEDDSKFIFKQIIEGLYYLHKNKIVHRDIKPANILIDIRNSVKLCDFNTSLILKNGEEKENVLIDLVVPSLIGTRPYMAPEIIKGCHKGYSCDIWSAGITLYQMLTGKFPFQFDTDQDIDNWIFNPLPKVTDECNDILRLMLIINPNNRITIDKLRKHKWVAEVELADKEKYPLFDKEELNLLSKYHRKFETSKDILINFDRTLCQYFEGDDRSRMAMISKSLFHNLKEDQYFNIKEEMRKKKKEGLNLCEFIANNQTNHLLVGLKKNRVANIIKEMKKNLDIQNHIYMPA